MNGSWTVLKPSRRAGFGISSSCNLTGCDLKQETRALILGQIDGHAQPPLLGAPGSWLSERSCGAPSTLLCFTLLSLAAD